MADIFFDLQRFAGTIEVSANDTYERDGVTYTATVNSQLTLDDDEKISGLASGSVIATVTGAENSPAITFDATNGAINFTATGNGEIIAARMVLPLEIIGGEFTFDGSTLSISAGSDLAIVTANDNYSLRNENHFVYDSTYTFSSTTMISDGQRVNGHFVLSDGTATRELDLIQLGKVINNFRQRGFTLVQGSSEVMNIGDYTITATAVNNDAGLNIELGANGIKLVPNTGDGTLNVALSRGGNEIFSGELECTSGEITFGYDHAVTFAAGTSFNFTRNGYTFTVTATDEATTAIELTDSGISFTPQENDGGLNILLSRAGTPVFGGQLNISGGTIHFDSTTQKFSFTQGTKISLAIGDGSQQIDMEIVGDDASFKVEADTSGNFKVTPDSGDGSIDIAIKRDGETVLSNNLSVSGSMIINPATKLITLVDGATISAKFATYDITAIASGNAASAISISAGEISFAPQENDGALNIVLSRGGTPVFGGTLNVMNGSITFNQTTQKFTVTDGTKISLAISGTSQEIDMKIVGGDASFKVEADTSGNFKITPDTDDGKLDITFKQDGTTIVTNTLSIDGSIVINPATQAMSLTQGTTINLSLLNYEITATANNDAGVSIRMTEAGFAITPADGDGTLDVSIARDGTTIFQNTVEISGGSIIFNPTTQLLTITDGTTIDLSFGNYNITATASGDAASSFAFTDGGIAITPQEGDGSLDITLTGTSSGSLSANIEVISGSFILGQGGALTVAKGTELKIDFGDGYIVNFKAIDEAGGLLSLGAGGITFVPGSDDGGLELSVTQNGETRTANLDVTGSITYSLDGSISLTENSAVRSVFEDGIEMIVTAGENASGTITFNPAGGLDITPAKPEDFTLVLIAGEFGFDAHNITGTLNYKSGLVTAYDGTEFYSGADDFWPIRVQTTGGSFSLQPGMTSTVYTANEGATLVIDYYNNDSYWEIQNGALTANSHGQYFISAGTALKVRDNNIQWPIILETAGDYTLNGFNVTTTEDNVQVQLSNYDTIIFAQDAPIKISSDEKFFMISGNDGAIQVTTNTSNLNFDGDIEITDGEISFDNAAKKISVTAGTIVSIAQDEQVIKFTGPEEISADFKIEEGILYFDLDEDVSSNISVTSGNKAVFMGDLAFGGVVSYNPATGTFGLTGANSSHGDGTNSFAQFTNSDGYSLRMATNDTTVVFVPKIIDGKLEIDFPNERKHELLFTLSKDGATTFEGQVTIGGTVGFDVASKELSLTKGTVVTLVGDGKNSLELTALDDASGQLTFTEDGIKFAPNAGDGQLELNFVATDRKANLDVTAGAIILKNNGTLALEKDTVLNLTWEDGTTLKLAASDTGGAIGFDAQGLKISSDGELSIDLTTATGVQTTLSNINGTIHYNAGKVLFDTDSTLTATSTLGGLPIELTLESNGEGGYVEISANGTNYVAGTGALQITWARDDKSSTFSVNNGSVFIGHGVFEIAEGTELSTDLKDLVPALYFTTTDAGTYTINGQTITTSTENISMTATDDLVTFNPGDAIIEYDGMYFTGDGNVSLTQDGVILGAGIEATGFGEKNTFILTEKGTVTADGKIFELTEDVSTGISVKGAADGFIFARTITAESEERLGIKNSTDIGKTFTEKFFAKNDDTYRVQTDLLGLQQIIGITSPVTVTGSADVDGENEETIFDIVTDNDGEFAIGEKNYTIGGDSSVVIKAIYNETIAAARGFDDLNGTVSGDFTEHAVTINGGISIIVKGDDDVAISATDNGLEIFNVSDGATLETAGGFSKVHTDGAGEFVFGAANEYDSLKIVTDGSATFEFDDKEYLTAIDEIKIKFDINPDSGKISYVSSYDDLLFVYGVENVAIETDSPEEVWVQMTGESMTLNGNELTLAEDVDGIWIRDKEIVGLDENASLTVGEAGVYTTSVTTLDAKAGDVIVGLGDDDAYIYDEKNPLVTKKSTTEEIIDIFKPNDVTIIGSESRGKFDVTLNGGDLAVVEDTAAFVNITAGNDTVVSKGGHVNVNLTDGNTWLFPLDGKMTLENYDHSTGTGFGTNYSDIENAIYSGAINFNNGILTLVSAKIDMGEKTLLMNFFDRDGNLQKIGYASAGDELDASKETADLILVAEDYSTIRGGKGDDLVFGNAGDFIDAGAGDNYIEMPTEYERYEHDQGATINIVDGDNTITGFQTGFDFESDAILVNGRATFNTFDGENVTIKTGSGTTILEDVGDGESFVRLKESSDSVTYNVAVAQKNSVIAIGSDLADMYVGENSGIDFTGYDGTLFVDLDSKRGTAENSDVYFYGINKLTAGGGVTSLIGSAGDDILTAGNGRASIWGNWGNDLMVGNKSSDKMFATEFFFFAGDGRDTIENFNFGTNATADKINTGDCDINTAYLSGDDVVIELDDGAYLTVVDAAGKDFKIANMIAKVDTNVEFDGAANCYVATNNSATLTVNSDVESAEILLDGSGAAQFFGDIRTLDASNAIYATISGNALDNEIIGAEKHNTFNYMLGGGNDSISNVHDGDVINLEFTLDEISSAEINSSSVKLEMNDGGSLTVDGTSDVTYRFADGTTYGADHNNRKWIAK